jgi:cysteine synthase
MRAERHPVSALIVMSAGTGGTTATIGRYIRYRRHMTRVCAVDVEYSVFFDSFVRKDRSLTGTRGSRIEGIGRPRVEPSFIPEVIEQMIRVPDTASLAAMRELPVGSAGGWVARREPILSVYASSPRRCVGIMGKVRWSR